MKIQKSVMTPRQIEVTDLENVVWAKRLEWSLQQHTEIVNRAELKVNMTLIVNCKLGQRDKVIEIIEDYEAQRHWNK